MARFTREQLKKQLESLDDEELEMFRMELTKSSKGASDDILKTLETLTSELEALKKKVGDGGDDSKRKKKSGLDTLLSNLGL